MVNSQPMEEEFRGAVTREVGTETHEGPTEPVLQMQKTPSLSPAFIKENIDVLRTMIKEHDQQARMKATPRKLAYVDSEKEAPTGLLARGFSDRFSLESSGTSDTRKQTRSASKSQRTPSKNKEPTHLRRSRMEDRSITKEKARRERSKPKGKRSRYQETSSDFEREEGSEDAYESLNSPYKRPKPTPFTLIITRFKYHMRAKLPQNIRVYEGNKDPEDHLSGAARNWFDDLDHKSVGGFEELSQKFLEEFSQQKRYSKDPTEIHAEMVCPSQRDKRYIRLSWIGGPEKARNRSDLREARRNMGVYTLYPQKYTFTPLIKTPKEILVMESVSFPEPPPLIETPVKQNLNKFCNYHRDKGHNTNDCYQLKKKIEEVVASEKLAHLVKDIRRNNQRGGWLRSNLYTNIVIIP
ncbi:hypothetical protein Tco_1412417 [Tanacetum coccineum]